MINISVTHTVSSIEDLSSGVSYSAPRLARAQGDLGHKVKLLSLGESAFKIDRSYEEQPFPNSMRGWPILNRLGVSRAMRNALSNEPPEIIHSHGLWMMPNIYRSKKATFIISPHGMLSPVALSYSPKKKRLFSFAFQDRALTDAALFHATAGSEYEDIRRYGLRQPVAVIPNGIDIPPIGEAKYISSKREVLSLGRIHKKKGLASLIKAWAEVSAEFPDWRLRIVGPDEGGHAHELESLIKNLALQSVTIEGPIFGVEKMELMSSVDLFVLPTLSENFAMTVAESLAVGVPVISTRGAPWKGLRTYGCGWWIDHGPGALAATLREALALPIERRRQMGARGRDWMIRDFSWKQIATNMISAYQWTKSGGTPPPYVWID